VTLPALSQIFAQPDEVGRIYGQFLAEQGFVQKHGPAEPED